ncbi:hypothetical protein HSR121_0872 [Halapricum desulfuricans]|uniref:Uncharacterized protein n=1 Tax=Halapricum desulfuricans TaxID=2841257 RepID=A0A897MX88_9EURY|nr:hypothetical protein HSR121_0872 [Halapricum desulfuricans]
MFEALTQFRSRLLTGRYRSPFAHMETLATHGSLPLPVRAVRGLLSVVRAPLADPVRRL